MRVPEQRQEQVRVPEQRQEQGQVPEQRQEQGQVPEQRPEQGQVPELQRVEFQEQARRLRAREHHREPGHRRLCRAG